MTLAPSPTASLITVLSVVFPLISVIAVIAVAVWRHRSHLPVSTDPTRGWRGYFFGDRAEEETPVTATDTETAVVDETETDATATPVNAARHATLPRGVDMSIYDQV